jgi:Rod binding domain-containing protein
MRAESASAPVAARSAPPAATKQPDIAKVATEFESLFLAQILKSAHAAKLADDPLAGDAEASFRSLQDETTARALAAAAPLGVARQLGRTP